MKYSIKESDKTMYLRIEGSISDEYLRDIRDAFDRVVSGEKDVVLNLSEVTFISSSGLGLIFYTNARLQKNGFRMVISSATDTMRRLFAVTRIDDHIAIFNDDDEASKELGHI
ncbi:MAG TPA: STAS domain-containing protein [Spirochaetota bacterium]|nr:STAS domain-containing protein [Spirochaetota bacterium]